MRTKSHLIRIPWIPPPPQTQAVVDPKAEVAFAAQGTTVSPFATTLKNIFPNGVANVTVRMHGTRAG